MSSLIRDSFAIYQKRIHLAAAYINTSISEPVDLELLAKVAGFSPYHFSRIFTAVMGETPMKYVLRLRLESAANLLIKSTKNLTQIAMECGFSSPSTFTRAFNRFFQCSPSSFRKQWGYRCDGNTFRLDDERIQNPGFSISTAQIQKMVPLPIIYTATYSGYTKENICGAWNRLRKWALLNHLITPTTIALGISLDDPFITRSERCRYYACLSVTEAPNKIVCKNIDSMTIPAGDFAIFSVKCKTEALKYVYQNIFSEWLLLSGYQPANTFLYEVYLSTPEESVDGLMDLLIHIPIEPIRD